MAVRGAYKDRRIRPGVQLVADGFPRSANTYFAEAFLSAQQPGFVLAGHAHSAGLLRKGTKLGLPTVLIIREPSAMLASYRQFSGLGARDILRAYISFHRRLPERESLYVADFSMITTDLGSVIKELNGKFDTDFGVYEKSAEAETRVLAALDRKGTRSATEGVLEQRVSRPSKHRSDASAVIAGLNPRERRLLSEATDLYREWVGAA
jgi:hypothetical protein